MFKRLFPICFAMILLAAHFSRNGNTLLAFATILLPFLLFIKRRWVIYFLQTFTWLGSLSWAVGTYNLVTSRMAYGQPWAHVYYFKHRYAIYNLGRLLVKRCGRKGKI